MNNVVAIHAPPTMALFYSTDAEPKFGVRLCAPDRLFDAVVATMFFGELTQELRDEANDVIETLTEDGQFNFEDGWLVLKSGLADIVAFMNEKVIEEAGEVKHAEGEWAKELAAREAIQRKYDALRSALNLALGENGRRELRSMVTEDA